MSNVIDSHKPAEIFTFVPNDNPSIIEELSRIRFNSDDTLSKNYQNINWHEFSAISIYKHGDTIIGFSSIWHRPEFYESGEVRILNRYWESNTMRKISKVIAGNHLIEMINQQITIAKELGFTKAFISRERTPRYFKQLINNIGQKTATAWTIEPDKVCVCKKTNPSCWQYKAWTSLVER